MLATSRVAKDSSVDLKTIEELRNLFLEVLNLADVMLENNQKEEYINKFDEIVNKENKIERSNQNI